MTPDNEGRSALPFTYPDLLVGASGHRISCDTAHTGERILRRRCGKTDARPDYEGAAVLEAGSPGVLVVGVHFALTRFHLGLRITKEQSSSTIQSCRRGCFERVSPACVRIAWCAHTCGSSVFISVRYSGCVGHPCGGVCRACLAEATASERCVKTCHDTRGVPWLW